MSINIEQNQKIILREIFSTGIARKMLNPNDSQMQAMLDFMIMVEKCSFTQEKQDTQEQKQKVITGDTFGMASIHHTREFEWLTHEIEDFVLEYLEARKINYDKLSLFHQKSWPVITRTGGVVNHHNHPNATLSAVFYLQTEPQSGGELIFENPADSLIPGNIHNKLLGKASTHLYGLKPIPKLLVLFPSKLFHYVNQYQGEMSRWSVSYDISITANDSLGSGQSENMMVHPSLWREFGVTEDASTKTAKKFFITQKPAIEEESRV